jgi:hypothetical protein
VADINVGVVNGTVEAVIGGIDPSTGNYAVLVLVTLTSGSNGALIGHWLRLMEFEEEDEE